MADKGKGKAAPAPAAPAAPPPPPPPQPEEPKKDAEPSPKKEKSPQPKDEVGTRRKCRRYRWELKQSNKEFWVMGHGEVKFITLGFLVGALVLFSGLSVHPGLTLIIAMELSVLIFFITVYSFAINRYMAFILWPVTDLLNDLVAFGFLMGAMVYAVRSRPTMHMHYFIAIEPGAEGKGKEPEAAKPKEAEAAKPKEAETAKPKEAEAAKAKEAGKPKEAPKAKGK
ncbi:CKLF-like MARVEL transmembrane domain-containing protein 2 [Rhynchocyon petersi]